MRLVSIIMGIYNCADTLEEAIDSILQQTYPEWELIMCDDGSTDDTYAVADRYRQQYPDRIVLLKNGENKKLAFTLNHCLQHARGYYVARMDGDDISLPERLAREVAYLEAHPDIQVVGTGMQRFDEQGYGAAVFTPEHPTPETMKTSVPFFHATIMTYKSVYDALGGYTVARHTERSQDWELWFRFFSKGFRGDNLQEALYLVREDRNAVKRRSFSSRLKTIKSTFIGYRMLGFPPRAYIRPLLGLLKGLVPSGLVLKYRKRQARKAGQTQDRPSTERPER